jgi:hypothetical protein
MIKISDKAAKEILLSLLFVGLNRSEGGKRDET